MSANKFIQKGKIKLLVAGEVIKADLDEILTIVDIGSEMDSVAALMGWWGGVLAAAKAEAEKLDGLYRQWRARTMIDVMKADKALSSEWKAKLRVDASPDFMNHKNAKALAIRNVAQLETIMQALKVKSEQLRSKGANMRFEMGASGMSTKKTSPWKGDSDDSDDSEAEEQPRPRTSAAERQRRAERLKAKNRSKRTPKDS
jgi:hypothetical protein